MNFVSTFLNFVVTLPEGLHKYSVVKRNVKVRMIHLAHDGRFLQ